MHTNPFWLIFQNPVLWPALLSWLSAQLIKMFIGLAKRKRLDLRYLFSAGGMPSSHTAMVSSMATSVGLRYGWDSMIFGIVTTLALIVMYDAAGVRRAAGKQAATINRLVTHMTNHDPGAMAFETLKELLGHTPFEVLAGATLGIAIAIILGLQGLL